MKFSTYMNASIYLMVVTGLLAIGLVEEVNILFVIIASLVTLSSLIVKIYKPQVKLPPKLLNILSIVLLLLFFLDYKFLTASLIGSAARFITILALLKLYDLKNRTDYMLLSMLVFFQLLSASASTVSPLFFAVMSLFIISSIWAMVLFNIEQDWNDNLKTSDINKEIPRGMFNKSFFTGTVIATFISIIITLLLFFIIPRMGIGLMQKNTINTIKVSGFSDEVNLGDLGSVKLDDTIVMRLEIDKNDLKKIKSHPLYLRGKTFKNYKDNKWTSDRDDHTYTKKSVERFALSPINKNSIKHTILLEPLSTSVIFGISYPQAFEGNFKSLWRSPSGDVKLASTPYSKIQYTVWSDPLGQKNAIDNFSEYLIIPDDYEEVKDLTLNITSSSQNNFERAKAIESYLKTSYKYTLSPKAGKGKTPIHDFLFNSKEGYCEQFSSAMVIMLRSIGIPARLATGFIEGQWNEYGSYYIVRQRDAHSWVESYIETSGSGLWITLDPTPPGGLLPSSSNSRIGLYIDSLQMQWTRYVINFTSSDQIKIASNVENQALTLKDKLEKILSSRPSGNSNTIIVLLVSIILIISTVYYIKLIGRSRDTKTPQFYLNMLSIMEKKGFKKKLSETPSEFATRCKIRRVTTLTEIYEDIRFGHVPLNTSYKESTDNLLEGLKKEL